MLFSRKHFWLRPLRTFTAGTAAVTAVCYLALSLAAVNPAWHHHPLEYEASAAGNHSDAPPAAPDSFGHEHADHCALCQWHALGQNAPTPPPEPLQPGRYVQALVLPAPRLFKTAALPGSASPRGPPRVFLTSIG